MKHGIALLAIAALCGCVTTTSTRTLVDPDTGESIQITEERKDISEAGMAVGQLAVKAAYDYVGFKADAQKQKAEAKRSMIGDVFGWQKMQQERHDRKAEESYTKFQELGGPDLLTDAARALIERVRAGNVNAVDVLPDPE